MGQLRGGSRCPGPVALLPQHRGHRGRRDRHRLRRHHARRLRLRKAAHPGTRGVLLAAAGLPHAAGGGAAHPVVHHRPGVWLLRHLLGRDPAARRAAGAVLRPACSDLRPRDSRRAVRGGPGRRRERYQRLPPPGDPADPSDRRRGFDLHAHRGLEQLPLPPGVPAVPRDADNHPRAAVLRRPVQQRPDEDPRFRRDHRDSGGHRLPEPAAHVRAGPGRWRNQVAVLEGASVPLIQIDLDRDLFDSLGDKLSDAVHQAQVDALDIPSDDLFQVFTPHGPGELRFDSAYNGVDRQRLLLLRITMVHMYPVATKQRLYRAIVERFTDAGVRAEDILISVVENGYEDWSDCSATRAPSGEVFNVTGEDVYTWDQIYTILAGALGVEARIVHVASELFPVRRGAWRHRPRWRLRHLQDPAVCTRLLA